MGIIYAGSEDKFVHSNVLYAKDTSDGFVYSDSEYTKTINRETLLDLCMKGLVVVLYKGTYHYPVYFKDSSGTVTITIATTISASASATLDLKSKEEE